jgi:hypothetical protein
MYENACKQGQHREVLREDISGQPAALSFQQVTITA